MFNNLIIGAGNLGSRHLQGLLKAEIEQNVFVVEPSEKNAEIAKQRADQIVKDQKIAFFKTIDELPTNIDLGIIATNSDVRLQIIQELVKHANIKNIVLEKVLFQSIEELNEAKKIFDKNQINVWVNCPRRMQKFYQSLKEIITPNQNISISFIGSNWGLACNSIHFLDLFSFFTESIDFEISTFGLEKNIYESKRKGFIEFFGSVLAKDKKGNEIYLKCLHEGHSNSSLIINTNSSQIYINESKGEAFIALKEKDWEKETVHFDLKFQSDLTGQLAEDILKRSKCNLTTYDESMEIHQRFLASLIDFYNENTDESISKIKIT